MEGPNTTFHPQKDESTNNKVNTVQEDNGHGTSTGALAGIAFGCTALLAIIAITTFLVRIAPSLVTNIRNILQTQDKIYNAVSFCVTVYVSQQPLCKLR